MWQIIAPYITLNTDVAFLQIKQDYINNRPWLIAFYIHVFSSIFALAAGCTQFSNTIRQGPLHRWIGRSYVFNILLITGPSSLLMAFYANGGLTSRVAFLILSILWWGYTYLAYRSALNSDFIAHRRWMLRSFALTLSAITLRLWKMALAHYFEWPPMDIYRLVAWLGFVPNLLAIECYLYYRKKKME